MTSKYYIKCCENKKFFGKMFEDCAGSAFDQDKPNPLECFWYSQKLVAQDVANNLEKDYNITCEVVEVEN